MGMAFMNEMESLHSAALIKAYLPEGAKVLEVGFGKYSSPALNGALKDFEVMDIEEEKYEGIKTIVGDATVEDLSKYDAIVTLGLPKFVMDVANKLIKKAGEDSVETIILSPNVTELESYEVDKIEKVGDKDLYFLKLK
jgi:hypothetical protein